MEKRFVNAAIAGELHLATEAAFAKALRHSKDHLKFIWNRGTHTRQLRIQQRQVDIPPQALLCCTYLHRVEWVDAATEDNAHPGTAPLTWLSFNRAFYCIHTHDAEVSCNGLLFFGSNDKPLLRPDASQSEELAGILHDLSIEMDRNDRFQEEVLRLLLKRFIINCTRLARRQFIPQEATEHSYDLIRRYNVLIEQHFKQYHRVQDYARLLHRAPKTLANIFARHRQKTPLQVIADRLLLEAQRYLLYTTLSVKEIGHELGFENASAFSRFFKLHTGMSCLQFKEKYHSGIIAH